MSNGIKRIGKGLFAIFMIKLTLVVGVLAFQACQTESNFDNGVSEEAKTNFLAALQESNQRIREINLKKLSDDTHNNDKYEFTAKDDESPLSLKQICLEVLLGSTNDSLTNTSDPIDTSDVNTLGDVFDIADATNTRPVAINDSIVNDVANDPIAFGFSMCFDIQTEPIEAALDPAIQAARNFLLSRDLTEADIQEALDGADESAMIPIVHAVLVVEAEAEGLVMNTELDFMSSIMGVQTMKAQSWGIISGCAISTLGLDSLADLRSALQGKKVSGRALKNAFKKVAKQFVKGLSGWGTILLVIEFGACVAVGHAF